MSRTLLDCPYCGEMYEEGRTHLCPEGRKWNENALWHQYAAAALGSLCPLWYQSGNPMSKLFEEVSRIADTMIEEARKRGRV